MVLMQYPTSSSDLILCNLIVKLKISLKVKRFEDVEDIERIMTMQLRTNQKSCFRGASTNRKLTRIGVLNAKGFCLKKLKTITFDFNLDISNILRMLVK